MNELHGDRAFANGRGNALDGAMADIADHEYTGHARLEQFRLAVERPAPGRTTVAYQIAPGENEATLVSFDGVLQPLGPRLRADKDEERARGDFLSAFACPDGDGFQMGLAVNLGDFALRLDTDVLGLI